MNAGGRFTFTLLVNQNVSKVSLFGACSAICEALTINARVSLLSIDTTGAYGTIRSKFDFLDG